LFYEQNKIVVSKDLAHWETLTYVLKDDDILDLKGIGPAIRHYFMMTRQKVYGEYGN